MTDPKGRSIPQWQRPESENPKEKLKDEQENSGQSQASEAQARAPLIRQAKEFLEHDDIRDAPTDRKISFLESKGLTSSEIQDLLGVSRNADASSSNQTTDQKSPDSTSTSIPTSSPSQPPTTTTSTAVSNSSTSPANDGPPIITYPEFLIQAHRPQPLVTRQRLITTLYATASAGAIIHATSTYLVKPMLESLTEARHSLFGGTKSHLEELNEKLTGAVSTIPPGVISPLLAQDDDASSEASDPTELFHRDAGVQTSPISSTLSMTDSDDAQPGVEAAAKHAEKLRSIHAILEELKESGDDADETRRIAKADVSELQGYLEDLRYGQSRRGKWDQTAGKWVGDSGDDEINKVKAEIRGVKGVLLSARSFPAGGVRAR